LVGGPPSGGSTLLSLMLDSHPDILCGPETNLFAHPGMWRRDAELARYLTPGRSVPPGMTWARRDRTGCDYYLVNYAELVELVAQGADIITLADYFFKPRLVLEDKTLACEKSPPNVFAIDAALTRYPRMKAIVIVRSAEGVVRSLVRRGSSTEVAVLRWLVKTNLALQLAERFGAARVHLLRYEDLLTDPLRCARDLCAFLEVQDGPAAEAMVARETSHRPGTDASLSSDVGAAAAWQFRPEAAIGGVERTGEDGLPALAARLLETVRLDGASMATLMSDIVPLSARDLSARLGYRPTWREDGPACRPHRFETRSSQAGDRLIGFYTDLVARPGGVAPTLRRTAMRLKPPRRKHRAWVL
jgi:hypothetical protein